jgi:hypothetical protein
VRDRDGYERGCLRELNTFNLWERRGREGRRKVRIRSEGEDEMKMSLDWEIKW